MYTIYMNMIYIHVISIYMYMMVLARDPESDIYSIFSAARYKADFNQRHKVWTCQGLQRFATIRSIGTNVSHCVWN